MKLLMANHQLDRLAGSELHTLDLCRGFRRAGHEVCVFTLEPGLITRQMQGEGFTVYTERNVLELVEAPPDMIYLHHSTCEVFLGIVFSGKVPIVRGFVSKGGPASNPTNGKFIDAALYLSEGIRAETGIYYPDIPSRIARNVYDDVLIQSEVVSKPYMGIPERPKFAVVSNHLVPELEKLLEDARDAGRCEFVHFGGTIEERVPVTTELLAPFDAIITIGRTVLLGAFTGKPIFLCDSFGTEGWLTPENYEKSQQHSFSGRRSSVTGWENIARQLFDRSLWPDRQDLTWLAERVERDHGLSGRIRELEEFFSKVIENSPPPAFVPDGYRGVYNFLRRSGKHAGAAGDTPTTSKKEMKHLKSRLSELENELHSIKSSRVFKAMRLAGNLKANLLGR